MSIRPETLPDSMQRETVGAGAFGGDPGKPRLTNPQRAGL